MWLIRRGGGEKLKWRIENYSLEARENFWLFPPKKGLLMEFDEFSM